MIKYAQIVDEETKKVDVALGTDTEYYESIGMTQMDVEQDWRGQWYLVGYAPVKPEPTLEEQVAALEQQYQMNRWQREGILAEGSLYSDFAKSRAQQIEDLAEQLRQQQLAQQQNDFVGEE